jgi:two-component system catabolic regulation response regulator CreB/two-component system response regulator ChvI
MSKHTKKMEAVSKSTKEVHILLVDDEEDIADLLRRALKRMGHRVSVYHDPLMALEEFRAGSFDLALLDIRMPGMNGYQLLKEIRRLDRDLKCCFLTAFEILKEDFAQHEIPAETIDCFIKKPVHLSEFTRKVNGILAGI